MESIKYNYGILPLKEQYEKIDSRLRERLHVILPELMKRNGLDMWVVMAREYNEDPVYLSLVPKLERTAARLSCLVFSLNENGEFKCLSLCRQNPSIEKYYERAWDQKNETQWEALKRIITEKNPEKIGVNISEGFAMADGLTKNLFDQLEKALGENISTKFTDATDLAVGWLETRSPKELEEYPGIYKVAERIINQAFSLEVITPGKTKTSEVEWWIMERINDLGLTAWFTPTIDLQREGEENSRLDEAIILPGDILHCDVGIEYLGLCTDTQRLAYVRKDGEIDAPEGLQNALKVCNYFQDIVAECFVEGKTGNEILNQALGRAAKEGISATLYTHPIGIHGHGAGPIIGLWDNQVYVPLKGEQRLHDNTCYALELNTSSQVKEWGDQEATIYLEETIAFTGGKIKYIGDRQTAFILI